MQDAADLDLTAPPASPPEEAEAPATGPNEPHANAPEIDPSELARLEEEEAEAIRAAAAADPDHIEGEDGPQSPAAVAPAAEAQPPAPEPTPEPPSEPEPEPTTTEPETPADTGTSTESEPGSGAQEPTPAAEPDGSGERRGGGPSSRPYLILEEQQVVPVSALTDAEAKKHASKAVTGFVTAHEGIVAKDADKLLDAVYGEEPPPEHVTAVVPISAGMWKPVELDYEPVKKTRLKLKKR